MSSALNMCIIARKNASFSIIVDAVTTFVYAFEIIYSKTFQVNDRPKHKPECLLGMKIFKEKCQNNEQVHLARLIVRVLIQEKNDKVQEELKEKKSRLFVELTSRALIN